jgi:hypothetical protein
MKRLASIILCLLSATITSYSQGIDTDISNYAYADAEPCISVNPTNPNNIIAGWMRITSFTQISIFTKASLDGGQTWSSGTALPHLWSSFTSADVSIDFSSTGTAYISYIDVATSHDSGYVMTAASTDGGMTWSAPVKVISALEKPDKPIDRPWIAIDRSGGLYNNRIYITSKSPEEAAAPHHTWMKYSDNGTTWSPMIQLDDSIPIGANSLSMAVPAVGADGSVYAGYFSYNPSQSPYVRIIVSRSTDGGNNFTPYVVANLTGSSAITDTLYQFSCALSANPANSSNLVFSWTDGRYGDVDILSAYSNNSGASWSAPVRANDDVQGNGVGQDMSWAGFSADGKFALAWRDRRNGGISSQSPFEIYAAVSSNGGASFAPNYRLSSAPSPFINIQKGNDFLGLALTPTFIISDWCDLRTNNTEIFCRKEQLSTVIGIMSTAGTLSTFKCFPNPASQELTAQFELSREQQVRIIISDMQGRMLKEVANKKLSGRQSITFDISTLAAGSYMCRIECAEGVSQVSFEKMK